MATDYEYEANHYNNVHEKIINVLSQHQQKYYHIDDEQNDDELIKNLNRIIAGHISQFPISTPYNYNIFNIWRKIGEEIEINYYQHHNNIVEKWNKNILYCEKLYDDEYIINIINETLRDIKSCKAKIIKKIINNKQFVSFEDKAEHIRSFNEIVNCICKRIELVEFEYMISGGGIRSRHIFRQSMNNIENDFYSACYKMRNRENE